MVNKIYQTQATQRSLNGASKLFIQTKARSRLLARSGRQDQQNALTSLCFSGLLI